jgi:flavin reductase (DIM6/NTAB) family NADH-FMN oxidoreductase RutF
MTGPNDLSLGANVIPDEFRKAVSRFATGITVITCEDDTGIRGMTCNSFTSISLNPATVLVSLKSGKTHRAIRATGRFGVSILKDEHQSYSAYYSGRANAEEPPEIAVRGTTPTLRECLAWFECQVIQTVDIHDHTLFVGVVERCGTIDGAPLMFFESRYHRYTPPPANRLPERKGLEAAA